MQLTFGRTTVTIPRSSEVDLDRLKAALAEHHPGSEVQEEPDRVCISYQGSSATPQDKYKPEREEIGFAGCVLGWILSAVPDREIHLESTFPTIKFLAATKRQAVASGVSTQSLH